MDIYDENYISDEILLNIDMYTLEGVEYRNIIFKKIGLEYLIPICLKYNILHYNLLQSLHLELDNIPIIHKKCIISEYYRIIKI